MANLNNNNVYGLVPELGDLVTFITHNSSTTGRIIFRDESTIRVRPYNKPTHGIEFELNPETGGFLEKYGVTEIIIHEKRKDPHYSKQLAVLRGDTIEFYDLDGVQIGESKTVFEIYASETEDGLKFDDGTVIDFGFLGVPEGVGVLMAKGKPVTPENNSEYDAAQNAPINNAPEIDIDALIRETALVKEVPSEELVYDDSIQREDMFVSLLMEVDPSQQQNPRIMQRLYRITDLLLALKNAVREMPATAATPVARSFTANTILEALAKQPRHESVAAVLPVAAIKRVIYGDVENVDNSHEGVEIRKDLHSVGAAVNAAESFDKNNTGAGNIGPFVSYINRLLKLIESYSAIADGEKIQVDQEVIRTAIPPAKVDGLPVLDNKDASIQSENVTKVKPQIARLLSKSEIIDHKRHTKMLVAPADTAETVAHMLASPTLTFRRAPNRSSVLIWDVLASNSSRNNTNTFADMLGTEVKQIEEGDEEFTLKSLLKARIPTALAISDRNVATVCDSFGLRELEMKDELMDAIDEALAVGQQNWGRDYKTLIAAATDALRIERAPAIAPIGPMAEFDDEPLRAVLQAIKERERTLNTVDLAIMNELNKEAEGTLAHIYYGLLAGANEHHLANLKTTYYAENTRQQRNVATLYAKSREFASAPEIINCPHVHEYERIMKVKDDQKRMILFEKFFGEYQAGQKGDYYVCGTCQTNLVCKHEVMMLQEFLNQKESGNIHKELLLKFAGPVFEGNYTCKNCGQKIQEIEYDTSLEFDDEGRPLVGRSIVEEEPTEVDEVEEAISSDKYQDLPFDVKEPKARDKLKFYRIARTIMESIGYVAPKEVYARMLNACIDYFEQRVPFTIDGIDKGTTDFGRQLKKIYKSGQTFFDTYHIAAIGALALLEFQINNPDIPISAPGCTFSRSGFPRDGSIEATGRGAFDYVVCVISSISYDYSPWINAIWTSVSDKETRYNLIGNKHIMMFVNQFLGSKGDLTTVSSTYRELLTISKQENRSEAILQTDADLLPPSFRPLPRFDTAKLPAREPIGNVDSFMTAILSQDITEARKYTYDQEQFLIHEIIGDFHQSGQGSVAITGKRSDGDCCFGRLSEVHEHGFGLSGLKIPDGKIGELKTLIKASNIVHSRDPTAVNAGTHIFVPWSAPQVSTELPRPSESSYYQLFLKHCSKGSKVGYIHEFDTQMLTSEDKLFNEYVCRNCGFKINDKLFLSVPVHKNDDAKLYGRIASELVGDIAHEEFKQLEQDVRTTKLVTSSVDRIPDVPAPTILLESFVLLPSMKPQQRALVELISALNAPEFGENRDLKFRAAFGKLSAAATDSFRQAIALEKSAMPDEAWKYIKPGNKTQREIIAAKFTNILDRLSDDSQQGPRNVLHYFVIAGEQLRRQFYTINSINHTTMSRWFGKYSKTHLEVFKKSWASHFSILEQMKQFIDQQFSEEDKMHAETVLSKFTTYLGPLTQQWLTYMHSSSSLLEFEIKEIYKWIATVALTECLNAAGEFYIGDIPDRDSREKIAQFMKLFIVLSLEHAETNISRFQKSPDEIREAINARITNERAKMVQRIDKEARQDREITLANKKLGLGEWNFKLNYDSNFKQAGELGLLDFDPAIAERGARAENAAEAYGIGSGRAEGADAVGETAHGEFEE